MHNKDIKLLKKKAFSLKPVVLMGQKGLSEALLSEIDLALEAHELIKIRLTGVDKADYGTAIERICEHNEATAISRIGHVLTLYRAKRT